MSSSSKIFSKLHKVKGWLQQKEAKISQKLPRVDKTIDLGAETTYSIGVLFSNLQTTFSFPDAAAVGIAMGWNYLDAIGLITRGFHAFLDKEDYHRSKYPQAVMNILGGLQAFAFTYMPPLTAAANLSPLALAGPAFALEELCGVITKSIDFYHIHKQKQFSGWLEEKNKEIKNLTKLVMNLSLKMLKPNKHSAKNQEKILKYIKKIENSLKEIISRSRIFFNTTHDEKQDDKINLLLNHLQFITDLLSSCHQEPTDNDRATEMMVQSRIKKQDKRAREDLIMKCLSFIGMVFLAVAPFTGPAAPFVAIPGFILVSIVTFYYLYTHRHDIKQKLMDFAKFLHEKYQSLKVVKEKLQIKHGIHHHSFFHHHTYNVYSQNREQAYTDALCLSGTRA